MGNNDNGRHAGRVALTTSGGKTPGKTTGTGYATVTMFIRAADECRTGRKSAEAAGISQHHTWRA